MLRLFEQHRIRPQKELEGIWKFVREDGVEYDLPVPGCWEQHPGLRTYRGKGTFYKRVYVKTQCHLRLEFKGVSHTADVFFDDAFVMHHYNAYTPFCGIVKDVAPGEHMIRVQVDNTFGEHSALHVPNDYYTYGGIIRPVAMEELGPVYIQNVRFFPRRAGNKWVVEMKVWIENLGAETRRVELKSSLAGITTSRLTELEGGAVSCVAWEQDYPQAESWSPSKPKLYAWETLLLDDAHNPVDDYIDRVGFREISIRESRLCINGEPVFLKGFNRHEDYGMIGSSIPIQLMAQDMDLMQEMGANAVRTSHYPNDERFLDLCDERGIMVWEENHARGFGLTRMQNPNFERQCENCIDEMISCHFNHPSIVIWGILNECASDTPEGRIIYQKQYEQIKGLDASRPVTSATCRHFTDICLDLPDIVSFNMYSGWYQDISVLERHNREMDWICKAGGAGKPVIVSEFGAGAIYGFRDRGRCKWSEERQADLIRENLEVYSGDERLTGVFIWQFADCKVTEEEWFKVRPRCYNNKGVVDEYRRPKDAFDVVKEMFPAMGTIL